MKRFNTRAPNTGRLEVPEHLKAVSWRVHRMSHPHSDATRFLSSLEAQQILQLQCSRVLLPSSIVPCRVATAAQLPS